MKTMTLVDGILGSMMGLTPTPLARDYPGVSAKAATVIAQSSMAVGEQMAVAETPASDERQSRGSGNWFGRALDRMDDWARAEETRQREAYLADATDLCDLEARLRRLDGSVLTRSRGLN